MADKKYNQICSQPKWKDDNMFWLIGYIIAIIFVLSILKCGASADQYISKHERKDI
jgi:hypothetical protein